MELAAIYTEFHRVLLAFIKGRVNHHQDAEDILQNVFIKLSSGISSLERKEKLQSWIYTIARNSIIDYYRSRSNKNGSYSVDAFDEDNFTEEEYNDTTKGLDCCLTNFVMQLPEEYRNIIIDVEIKGMKQKELGEMYNLAYPSIRSRVQRGREKLKQILLECCHVKSDNRGNVLEVVAKTKCENGKTCNK